MTFQKNASYLLGTSFDWPNGGNTPIGEHLYIPHARHGVNRTEKHRPDRDGKYRVGGKWLMGKLETKISPSKPLTVFRPGFGRAYQGQIALLDHHYGLPVPTGIPNDFELDEQYRELFYRGAEAWNALRPDVPSFNAAASLSESVSELLTLRFRTRTMVDSVLTYRNKNRKWFSVYQNARKHFNHKRAQEWADLWLANQFGWMPLLSDIKDFTKSFLNREKAFKQLLRDEGKSVRRRKTLPSSDHANEEHSVPYSPDLYRVSPQFVTQCYIGPRHHEGYYKQYNRVWAVGKFKYFLPSGPRDEEWRRIQMQKVLGVAGGQFASPQTIWELVPWSWLVDYFSGVGQFMEAISGGISDNLIADYCYLMMEKTAKTVSSSSVSLCSSIDGQHTVTHSSITTIRSTKIRLPASKFGFGLDHDGLSLKQLSILGALGISRL